MLYQLHNEYHYILYNVLCRLYRQVNTSITQISEPMPIVIQIKSKLNKITYN